MSMKRNRSVRRKLRTAVRYIITFVLMICMMCSLSLGVAKYSMLSTRAVLHTCDRVEYYDGLATELEHESYRLGIPYGISKKMVKGVFDKKELRRNIEKVIESGKKDQTPSIDTYNIRQNIQKNVEKEKGKLSKKQKESLDTYILQVENMYHKKVYIPGVDTIARVINATDKVALICIPLMVLIAIVCIFYLIASRRYVYHGIRYIAYSVIGAGITLLTVFAAAISDGSIYRFNISDVYMRKFFTYWIGHEMLMQVFAGIGFLIVGALLIYMVIRQKVRVH